MDKTTTRRQAVAQKIKKSDTPLSASTLAKALGVSRQIIVGDVAMLRAAGEHILATPRGYIVADTPLGSKYVGKIACKHPPSETLRELSLIVGLGAVIQDVIVEHEVYGELTGSLRIATQEDIDLFMVKLNQSGAKLLSELTAGIHIHTIICENKSHFERVKSALVAAQLTLILSLPVFQLFSLVFCYLEKMPPMM